MAVDAVSRPSRLLDGLAAPDRARASAILAASTTIEIESGIPYFQSAFGGAVLLVVEDGFVVVRAAFPPPARSVVTSEAGAGAIVLPPHATEVLAGLGKSHVTPISRDVLDQLLTVPAIAARVAGRLMSALGLRQEAIANFAPTRHVERVRRKLLHLARRHGHAVREGVRIDLPVSHALLAEMIGSSRETVTRALDELRRDGFLARGGSTYCLLVPRECPHER
jgi:hypothetical protein